MGVPRHHSALILASIVTVAAFLATSIYTQHQLVRLDVLSSTIEQNAAPSIEYLARAGMRLRRIGEQLHSGVDANDSRHAASGQVERELTALEQDVHLYLELTPLPGEQSLWSGLREQVQEAAGVARAALQAEEAGDTPQAASLLRTRADAAFDRAEELLFATLEFHVSQSERLAREVRELRAFSRNTVVVLDALAVLVAIAAVLIAFRASRQHDRLVQSHSALLRERVAELDRFSGRVAHDILSPLDTIGFGLALLAPSSDARQQTYVARAQRALQSVQRLVGDLLTFARSGARPGAQAVCALDSVLAEVVADCEEQARAADVELIVPPAHGLELACSPGVATSIVQNLVRNAIKYMGNAPVRKVIVRAERAGAVARLEVEDTGPGIPAERQLTIFEPFIRGPHEEAGGIGLGLATVKRLVEAHGGSVTVRSQVGAGSVFRVDLPLAVNPPSISVA